MASTKPPKKSRPKKININTKQQWESILRSITKDEIPMELLDSLTVNLTDGTRVNIKIKDLLDSGIKTHEVEHSINERLHSLSDFIVDIDFFICIDAVVNTVQPITDRLLKGI
jgi:hypothetical protein